MSYIQRGLVGREREMSELSDLLKNPDICVICIIGKSGTGKTFLANRLMEKVTSDGSYNYIRQPLARLHQHPELEDWLISSIASAVLPSVPPKVTRDKLQETVFTFVGNLENQRILLLIDNAESLDQEWLNQFVIQWVQVAKGSRLLLTTTSESSRNVADLPGYRTYYLNGISSDNKDAILSIFERSKMCELFSSEKLLEIAGQLDNIPQRLLYLRWLEPQNTSELHKVADELSRDDITHEIVESIKGRVVGPLNHFFALGRARNLQFGEKLLAYLWDNLVGGVTTRYIEVRDQLISEGLFTWFRDGTLTEFSINPEVHIQLEKHLIAGNLGVIHLPHVDYYLSEYYRLRFEETEDQPDIQLLYEYVYYSARAKNIKSAVQYVLETPRLSRLQSLGLALGLRRVFSLLNDELDKELKELEGLKKKGLEVHAPICSEIQRYIVSVRIELARCECDLSNYELCLSYLADVETNLTAFTDSNWIAACKREINYLRGISLGCLGRLSECIQSYLAVVTDAAQHRAVSARTIEALGYASMVLSYLDMDRARVFGERAMKWATRYGSSNVITKNKCSYVYILLFSREIDQAEARLKEAESVFCEHPDGMLNLPELGRILILKAMIQIARRQYSEAVETLEKATKINRETGNWRRVARAMILSGIALWRKGEKEQGRDLLKKALSELYRIQDWLDLTIGAFTYGYTIGFCTFPEVLRAAEDASCEGEIWGKALTEAVSSGRMVNNFGMYWESHYRPLLLENSSVP
jgi:hypothetical protein